MAPLVINSSLLQCMAWCRLGNMTRGPFFFLSKWINFNPSVDQYMYLLCVGWNCSPIFKLQRCNRWSLGMDGWFHLTLYRAFLYIHAGNKANPCQWRGGGGGGGGGHWYLLFQSDSQIINVYAGEPLRNPDKNKKAVDAKQENPISISESNNMSLICWIKQGSFQSCSMHHSVWYIGNGSICVCSYQNLAINEPTLICV